jgi:hypothetical protein
MAYYSIFPEKDTTIYSHPDRINMNTGNDEILEIVKEKGNSDQRYYPSRILIQFNNEEIKSTISDKIGSSVFNNGTTKVSLQLLSTEHKNLTTTLNIEAYAVSRSWNEGSGRFTDVPLTSNGASWVYRNNDIEKATWLTGSVITTGLTFGSSSININELPSGSSMELTINGIDFIPVISASLFDNSSQENYVQISSSIEQFGLNLQTAINASSSLTSITASFTGSTNILTLSGSSLGTNVTITTSSINGNNQAVFTSSIGNFSVQGATSTTITPFAVGTSGSLIASGITEGGGEWYTGSGFTSTQQFLQGDNLDVNLDVTTIVQKHSASLFANNTYPEGINNNGFIIKQPNSIETNTSSSFGELQYFSVDTHTIYPPKLMFKWDDSSYSIGSGTVLTSGDIFLSLHNNKSTFQRKSKQRFKLNTRKRYPDRTFTTSSNYLDTQYLPTSSYYSLRDGETDEIIIPFDTEYTKLSANNEGMYFDLWMEGLQPERYYKFQFRTDNNEGTQIFDEDYIFKVVR